MSATPSHNRGRRASLFFVGFSLRVRHFRTIVRRRCNAGINGHPIACCHRDRTRKFQAIAGPSRFVLPCVQVELLRIIPTRVFTFSLRNVEVDAGSRMASATPFAVGPSVDSCPGNTPEAHANVGLVVITSSALQRPPRPVRFFNAVKEIAVVNCQLIARRPGVVGNAAGTAIALLVCLIFGLFRRCPGAGPGPVTLVSYLQRSWQLRRRRRGPGAAELQRRSQDAKNRHGQPGARERGDPRRVPVLGNHVEGQEAELDRPAPER